MNLKSPKRGGEHANPMAISNLASKMIHAPKSNFPPVSLILKSKISLLLGVAAVALSACANIPNSNSNVAPIATYEVGLSEKTANLNAQWPEESWWRAYNDENLNSLIDVALNSAPSLDAAKLRINQAITYSEGVDATFGLSAKADASVYLQKQTYNGLFPKAFAPKGVKDFGQVALSASKDLDIWGQRQAQMNAAFAQIDAARANEAFIRLNLASSIVAEYAKLQNLYTQLQSLEAMRAIAQEIQRLLALRFKNGLEIKARIDQAAAQVAAIQLQITSLDEKIKLEKSAIAALMGKGAQEANSVGRPNLEPVFANGVPSNLRVELLGHRPDIIASKLRAIAAAQKVDIAVTKYYPNISIGGNIGLSSLGIGNLIDSGSLIGQFGPAISLPIFAQKTLDANLGMANADYNLAIVDYNQSILNAFSEIDQAAISFWEIKNQIAAAKLEVNSSQMALNNINLRFKGGMTTKLEVLNAQAALIDAKAALKNLEDKQLLTEIALIKSLGGGFEYKK